MRWNLNMIAAVLRDIQYIVDDDVIGIELVASALQLEQVLSEWLNI